MKNNWNTDVSYYQAVSEFSQQVKKWNKDSFGNIFQRKKGLLARIGGVQRALERWLLRSLYRLEAKLKRELEEVLMQEELFWLQKSKRDWVLFSDRNTAYFHQKTLTRWRRNRIDVVKAEDGRWLYDIDDIKKQATNFFFNLYTSEQELYQVCGNFPPIVEYRLTNLDAEIEEKEIRQAVFSMSPLKALGVDGLHAIFYQTQWHIVGESFCKVIKDVFRSQYIPAEIDRTLLVPIPKTEHPISFKMYRLISLCTVAYKTITKIITNRL